MLQPMLSHVAGFLHVGGYGLPQAHFRALESSISSIRQLRFLRFLFMQSLLRSLLCHQQSIVFFTHF